MRRKGGKEGREGGKELGHSYLPQAQLLYAHPPASHPPSTSSYLPYSILPPFPPLLPSPSYLPYTIPPSIPSLSSLSFLPSLPSRLFLPPSSPPSSYLSPSLMIAGSIRCSSVRVLTQLTKCDNDSEEIVHVQTFIKNYKCILLT